MGEISTRNDAGFSTSKPGALIWRRRDAATQRAHNSVEVNNHQLKFTALLRQEYLAIVTSSYSAPTLLKSLSEINSTATL